MIELKGTNVAAPIVPFTSDDTYATHEAKYGKGGFRTVADIAERNAIPEARLEEGMLVYVISDESKIHTYQYLNGEWSKSKIGSGVEKVDTIAERDLLNPDEGDLVYVNSEKKIYIFRDGAWQNLTVDSDTLGIPIYDLTIQRRLEQEGKLPDDYISIPDASDLNVRGSRGYEPGDEGFYVDILFNAIRSLQAEVAKLRNSFKYGIYSYTGKETAMSAVMDGYDETAEVEPLWAVEEKDLSPINDVILDIGDLHTLRPKENVTASPGILTINDLGAAWTDDGGGFLNISDPKLFLFLTTSGMSFKINLVNLSDPSDILTVDFSKLGVPKSASGKYNILFVVSRATKNTGIYYGSNFIWLSVANYASGISTNEGFWRVDNTLTPGTSIIGDKDHPESFRYAIQSVEFTGLDLYKFDAYSKFQDFTNIVSPNKPTDDEYKYRVAHLTIRSVANNTELDDIASQLPKNELIYNEATGGLLIKTANGVKEISGGGGSKSGMEKSEIIEWLAKNGIIVTADGTENIEIGNIADITFIHQGTGKAYKFEVNSDGKLQSTEIPDKDLEDRMKEAHFEISTETSNFTQYRGFVGELGFNEQSTVTAKNKDLGLHADRVKIGAIYAPRKEQKIYGCSHAYIELENTSDIDFPLDGCYLHFATGVCSSTTEGQDQVMEYSLALDGKIPAGGTYLVRGKQYADFNQANTFVKVETFDKEWYVGGNLIDFTLDQNNSWCLTYGLPGRDLDSSSTFTYSTVMIADNADSKTKNNAPWTYHPRYIDVVSIGARVTSKGSSSITWSRPDQVCFVAGGIADNPKDCIYKNTFELDPAKQAFQGLNTYDSSRKRNENTQDYQYVLLENNKISFPKTEDTFDVAMFTPKASFENKNVSTDKSKLDLNRPNMVTCSFGRNIHTTRCFNWISCGAFDEFIWIRRKGTSDWAKFESYKPGVEVDDPKDGIQKVTFGTFLNKTTGDSSCKIQSIIYDRMTSTFPGADTTYTSHKCILKIKPAAETSGRPVEYEYKVGRADINGNPDSEHVSDIQTFKLYPTSYTPRVFQTTDQQGFHWIEYQVWNAAAQELNKTINEEIQSENIIPILINTGDMTQNGTRINEWLDYYNGGRCLFDHLEQMNVVGNNDLCGPDPTILGTGDDAGKSNSYYFHVFYCYEIDPDIVPIISNGEATKYVPSLYYFGNVANGSSNVAAYRFVMINSELTAENCKSWFKQTMSGQTVNVYTGWTMPVEGTPAYDNSFVSVYTMVYNMIKSGIDSGISGAHTVAVCHEMPFTVVTNANLLITSSAGVATNCHEIDRSLKESKTGSLVGSHSNKMSYSDTKANYWLSRLLEYFGVKLCLGGHKHTYACTNPLREFYYYTVNDVVKNSLTDGKMSMTSDLSNDTSDFSATVGTTGTTADTTNYIIGSSVNPITINTSKFPLMKADKNGIIKTSAVFYPYYGVGNLEDGVTYFMCQATGYKLKSNRELPSPSQKFAYVIPKTNITGSSDKPNANQQRPMFAEIVLTNNGESEYNIYLYRIENIMQGTNLFSQISYSTAEASYKFLKGNEASTTEEDKDPIYGNWNYTTKTPLITI